MYGTTIYLKYDNDSRNYNYAYLKSHFIKIINIVWMNVVGVNLILYILKSFSYDIWIFISSSLNIVFSKIFNLKFDMSL